MHDDEAEVGKMPLVALLEEIIGLHPGLHQGKEGAACRRVLLQAIRVQAVDAQRRPCRGLHGGVSEGMVEMTVRVEHLDDMQSVLPNLVQDLALGEGWVDD